MAVSIEDRFMQQQGFAAEELDRRRWHFRALLFQPSIVGLLVAVAIIFQLRGLFFALAAVLTWNVAFPQWNPFERVYDRTIGNRRGQANLQAAPAPRRFAQGMAAAFMFLAGLALTLGWQVTAYVFEGFLVIAFTALLGGKFCLGAYIYHLLRGRTQFANATCPWSQE